MDSVEKNNFLKKLIAEQMQSVAQPQVASAPAKAPAKAIMVTFDAKTDRPFKVKFTERGFSIEGTRLSFEILDTALSKKFNIVLNNGAGLILDAVKMQKIKKYENYFEPKEVAPIAPQTPPTVNKTV